MRDLKIIELGTSRPGIFVASKKDNCIKIDSAVFPKDWAWNLEFSQAKRLSNWLIKATAKKIKK